jgi:hypothetical protein
MIFLGIYILVCGRFIFKCTKTQTEQQDTVREPILSTSDQFFKENDGLIDQMDNSQDSQKLRLSAGRNKRNSSMSSEENPRLSGTADTEAKQLNKSNAL